MMPAATQSMRSIYGTNGTVFVSVDHNVLMNWSVDSVAKRTILVGAMAILLCGSIPLMTSVHGQQPSTQIEFEVQSLRERVKALDNVPTDVALIVAHQRLEDERYKELSEFEDKIVWGFVGTSGSMLLGLFMWILHQFGITFGNQNDGDKRRRAA